MQQNRSRADTCGLDWRLAPATDLLFKCSSVQGTSWSVSTAISLAVAVALSWPYSVSNGEGVQISR